jgi:hypothetical protein
VSGEQGAEMTELTELTQLKTKGTDENKAELGRGEVPLIEWTEKGKLVNKRPAYEKTQPTV